MERINLRDYYPFYEYDFFLEVTDILAELLKQMKRKNHADYERRRAHKAYYSLDAYDGNEMDFALLVLSPEGIYQRKISYKELYASINILPDKQAKRIIAHFFLGMSKTEIASVEGVNKSTITRSIEQALKSMEKFLKNFSVGGQLLPQKSAD